MASLRPVLVAALTGLALTVPTATAATAATTPASSAIPAILAAIPTIPDESATALVLGVRDEASGRLTTTQLRCEPTGGRHPHAADACAALTAADGDFDKLAGRHMFCPAIERPVVAVARGSYRGQSVDYSREYANSCYLTRATGAVFDFTD